MSGAGCIFCQIAKGDAQAHVVHRSDEACVFLDTRPVFQGHCLVVPTTHIETLADLPAERVGPLMIVVQNIARAVERGLGCDGTFVAMNNRVSQSVPHLHVHVVPRRKKDGLRGFFWPRQKYPSEDVAREMARAIASALVKT